MYREDVQLLVDAVPCFDGLHRCRIGRYDHVAKVGVAGLVGDHKGVRSLRGAIRDGKGEHVGRPIRVTIGQIQGLDGAVRRQHDGCPGPRGHTLGRQYHVCQSP